MHLLDPRRRVGRDLQDDVGVVGRGSAAAEHALVVPSSTTARIQEMHLLLMHLLIEKVDAWAAGE